MRIYKKLLISLCFILAFSAFAKLDPIDDSKLKIYPIKEFIKHNNKESCWVLMDKYIYDVTNFLSAHPTSFKVLAGFCGKDGTNGYKTKGIGESHSDKANMMRRKMLIGILKEKMQEQKK